MKYIQIDFSTDSLFECADCNMHEFNDSEVQAVYLMVDASNLTEFLCMDYRQLLLVVNCKNGFDGGWMHLVKTVFSRIPNFSLLSLKANPHSFFLSLYLSNT